MKCVPLLAVSDGIGISAWLVLSFAVTVAFLQQTRSSTSSLLATGSPVNKSRLLKLLLVASGDLADKNGYKSGNLRKYREIVE